jgi:hypothetical protein
LHDKDGVISILHNRERNILLLRERRMEVTKCILMFNTLSRKSTTIANSKGDKGSPSHTSLAFELLSSSTIEQN